VLLGCGESKINNLVDDGYGPKYHTGKPCHKEGCNEPAGTAWGPHFCKQHDIERLSSIEAAFFTMVSLCDKGEK